MSETSLQILKRIAVEKKSGFSRSKIYSMLADPASDFPRPIRLSGGNSVGWYEHEIDAYLASRPRVSYRSNGGAA
jgi:prophage regulatory protein